MASNLDFWWKFTTTEINDRKTEIVEMNIIETNRYFDLKKGSARYKNRILFEELRYHEPINIDGNLVSFYFLDNDIPATTFKTDPLYARIKRCKIQLYNSGISYFPSICYCNRGDDSYFEIRAKHNSLGENQIKIEHFYSSLDEYELHILELENRVDLYENLVNSKKIKTPNELYSDILNKLEKEKEERRKQNEVLKNKKQDKNKALEEKLKWIEEQKRIHGKK